MNIDEQTQDDARKYHEIMEALRRLEMPHGTCEPRSRKACGHCAAAEKIVKMKAEYKGPMIRLA